MTTDTRVPRPNRRVFLETAIAAGAAATLPIAPALAATKAKYTRYSVTSPMGQKMLVSYEKGIKAMLALPPTETRNWFRNAFVHFMDCPHGNWWFYVWHRGYIGYFEQIIRDLSGDQAFTLPYWDWTELPRIPASMFDGALTPTDKAYEPYTLNLQVFTDLMKKPMETYWNSLSKAQRDQEDLRGYTSFDLLWNDVTGYSPSADAGISGNMAFATTCAARYLTKNNPDLNKKTKFDVSPFVVLAGLLPLDFYYASPNPKAPYNFRSFNSSKTASHVVQPNGSTLFSVLEGMPHNNVHNYIGGVGPLDPGPYGNMTNFLSPVDPIFFLHHSNMDRLWDVWTNKQKAIGKPFTPDKADFATYMNEPFLFYVQGDGSPVGPKKAADVFSTDAFDYDYQPGFPTNLLKQAPPKKPAAVSLSATVKSGVASLTVPHAAVAAHMAKANAQTLFASVEMPRPSEYSTTREYDVIVNAPAGVTQVDADSPYYAGTIAFFGCGMPSMREMGTNATFAVPLPQTLGAFTALRAGQDASLNIRLATPSGKGEAPAPVAVSVGTI